jgi:hypothetical protein
VKQTSHFTLRPPKIWSFGIKVFEQNAVQQPQTNRKMYAAINARIKRFITCDCIGADE